MEHLGLWSLVPPVCAILLAFVTRQVLPSLLISIWVGATIMSKGNPFVGFGDTFAKYIVGSLADPWKAGIIIFSLSLGGMIGITTKAGGAKAIAEWLGKRARSSKGGQISTWAMGLIIFFDDYSNTLLVGNTMRPVTDKLKISREKLAYICDSTSAPVASISLMSTWIAYEMGLLKDAFAAIGVNVNIYEAFILSVPYRFYCIVTLFFVLCIAYFNRDFGPMLKAEMRARREGKLMGDDANPLASKELTEMVIKPGTPIRAINSIIPVIVVILGVIIGLYINGRNTVLGGEDKALIQLIQNQPYSFLALRDIIGNADASVAMTWAACLGTIVAVFMVTMQKILTLSEAVEAWLDGAKSLMVAGAVLIFAWGIGKLCEEMGTAKFLVSILEGNVPIWVVPPSVFLIACVVSFSTGTSWGTAAILMPIAVPLAYKIGGGDVGTWFYATVGAVFSGSVFGDHCSPISDTTIMSSMASACDHIDHVKTQMPYALSCAGIVLIGGYIPIIFGATATVSLGISLLACVLLVRLVGKRVDNIVISEMSEEKVEVVTEEIS